jgi:hypothetical protein
MKKSNQFQFILTEYQQCFDHMRHYDNIAQDLFKFSFTFYSSVATITIAINEFFLKKNPQDRSSLLYLSSMLFLGFIIGNIIILLLVRNRKYFIDVAHQVNSIRGRYLKEIDFFENQLPADPQSPKFLNPSSSHFFIYYVFYFVNMIFLFISVDCFISYYYSSATILIPSLVSFIYLILGISFTFKTSKK